MTVVFKILTAVVQLTCLIVLLIKSSRRSRVFRLSLTVVSLFLLYNIWTITLTFTANFDALATHRIIGSAAGIVNYFLLFLLMGAARRKTESEPFDTDE